MAHVDANSGSGTTVAAAGHSHVIDMVPQLDASSGSTVAAANDHSHDIDMAQVDTNGRRSSCNAAVENGHVVIDIDAGGRGSTCSDNDIPSCVVCMEPLEWVAVGSCGHRVVCSVCAARVRSAPNSDHRCCICRAFCRSVLVTKAVAAAYGEELTFSKMPATYQDGRVGEYWYCAAMSAYFDDERQYEATAKAAGAACVKQPRRPSTPATSIFDEILRHQHHSADEGNDLGPVDLSLTVVFFAIMGAVVGFPFAGPATGWGKRVAIMLGSVGITATLGSIVMRFMYKNGYCGCGPQG